jgi:phage terminase large subunit-like protein
VTSKKQAAPYASYIHEYYAKIISGEIVVGAWILAVYKIIVAGLAAGEYFYDGKRANKAIRFIEGFCHHSKGRNDLIKLELWQKAIVSCIFGIVDAQKIRVFREIFIVIGRKNGKSLFASAVIAYMAYLEPEYGQEIYCLAPKLDQAALVYDGFYQMVQAEPDLAELAKKRRSDIYIQESNTVIKPIAFNAKKSDGFNPQLVVCDEMAAWAGDGGLKQYEVMKSALGARTQPMILSISTAGYINDSIYDELMKRSTSFLKGNSKERRLLPFLYIIDDVEKWNDLTELRKANPNMGVSVQESFFVDEIAIAETSLSKKAEFLTKYCNIKQNSSVAWLEYSVVEAAGAEITLDEFTDCYAVGGVDLSQTTDLTAASIVVEKNGKLYAFTKFFMPRNRLETLTATDGVPYNIFVKQGILTLSGENYVDYHDVFNWYVELLEEYGIRVLQIGYDRYSAQYLVDDLNNYGFHTDDVWQGENLTPVIREFEGIIKDGNFKIANNNLLKSHFLNVALKQNMETRKFRPVKIEQRAHIDGFVSVIDAMTVRQKWYAEIGQLLRNE